MPRSIRWAAALALTALMGIGCTDQATPPADEGAPVVDATTPADATATTPADATAPADAPATAPASESADQPAEAAIDTTAIELSEDELAQIKKLPAEDQALALEQKVCPSSGEPLGSMGVPIKVMANDTPVFVCCKGCVEDVEKDPAAALARLGKK